MKHIARYRIVVFTLCFLFLIISVPLLGHAQNSNLDTGLIPCGYNGNECTWKHLVLFVNKLIDYLVGFSVTLSIAMFSYAGFLWLTAGDNSGNVTKARGIFTNVVIGFILVLGGWLIIHQILVWLVPDPSYYNTILETVKK